MMIHSATFAIKRTLLIRISWASINWTVIVFKLTLLSLEALKIGILTSANFIFLRFSQHSFFRSFLRVDISILLILRIFIRCVRLVGDFALHHVVVILLHLLLIAHDLVQLHLTIRELAWIHFFVLCGILATHFLNMVHFYFRALLAIHVIILPLSVLPGRSGGVVILLSLKLLELCLRLTLWVVV